jgi:hypothetical protein
MTDSTKWKSVMLRVDTYELLKEVAARDRRPIASILTDLVFKEWEWHFARETYEGPKASDPGPRPKNPFLYNPTDPKVDR